MITVIYSTHKDEVYNNNFKKHLLQTAGVKNVQILEYVNHNQFSLSQVYNSGITESINNIVVCCHNDIKLEKNWGKKLLLDFDNNPDYAIIGKAGSCYFPESGVYWERMKETMVGQVYHHPEGQKKWLSKYSAKLPFLIPVVTIDGLFMSFDKTKIKHRFDESIGKFHFYDHLFTIPNYLDGVKIGVTSSFEITHESIGQPNQEFFESKTLFLEKYQKNLPLDLKPSSVFAPKITSKYPKKLGRVAIVIPTKGKTDYLFECIDSFLRNCDNNKFDIFVADTGSTKEEKELINKKILNYDNVKLIEYDYYNFSKINNDVVKNYVDSHEFLLFCNNDVKILNDVITEMVNQFIKDPKTGTVGCRLHYYDKTLQHDGISILVGNKSMSFNTTHKNSKNYYNYTSNTKKVFGSTAALLMIRKKVFDKCNMFDENYKECFEDVDLNINTIRLGLNNYILGNCVAYHYETLTRENTEIIDDANRMLLKFKENFNTLKPYVEMYYEQ
jgi:GT2 family glycosyltransferase